MKLAQHLFFLEVEVIRSDCLPKQKPLLGWNVQLCLQATLRFGNFGVSI
jgi:hypothetical protein